MKTSLISALAAAALLATGTAIASSSSGAGEVGIGGDVEKG